MSFPDLKRVKRANPLAPTIRRGTAIPNPSFRPSLSGPVEMAAAAFVLFTKDGVEDGVVVIVGDGLVEGVGSAEGVTEGDAPLLILDVGVGVRVGVLVIDSVLD